MKGTETGKNKVKKICDILRRETLEPAKNEAEEIIRVAKEDAERILDTARKQAERLNEEALLEIERQKNIVHSSLKQACKQAIASLKQSIEEKLFDQELAKAITKQTLDSKVLSQLITAVVKAVEKEGIEANLSVYVPAAIAPRDINALLAKEVLEKLKEKSVLIGPMTGGIEVKLHKDKVTVDITDAALKELVANYIRKDFREMIFGAI